MNGTIDGEECIVKLFEPLDSHIPDPQRDVLSPFLLPVESAFLVPNRGTVTIGTLQERLDASRKEILGHGAKLSTVLSDIQVRQV